MDVGIIRSYAEQGMTRQQIAESVGLSYNRVTDICREHGINPVRKKRCVKPGQKRGPRKRTKEIIQLRESGMKLKDIASAVGCTKDSVSSALRSYGLTKEQKLSEEYVAKIVLDCGFEYVSGFVASKKNITVMCKECCNTFERQFHIFHEASKGQRACDCPVCRKKKRNQTEKRRAEAAKHRKEKAEHDARIKAEQQAIKKADLISRQMEARLAIHVCKNCGNEYCIGSSGYDSTSYCSEKCAKRWANRIKNDRRIRRMKSRVHDNDITLEKLFSRDKGVCYLCGKPCDWSDVVDGNASDRYPSIDHVVPISKGGTHTWSNVKLACRRCNTEKSNNL